MIVRVSFCSGLPFRHHIKFSAGIQTFKNFHCAPVVNAEGDVTEPRLTLKQIERKKFEKRSEYIKRVD